jgi:integrase/recombinase XerD
MAERVLIGMKYPLYIQARDDLSIHIINAENELSKLEGIDIKNGLYSGWDSAGHKVAIEAATPMDVSNYLHRAIRWFRQRHGHSPCPLGQSRPRSSIHALLRLVRKRWPPEPVASNPVEVLCRTVCKEYREWLIEQRGLAVASVDALMWEARQFLRWYTERTGVAGFMQLQIGDIDVYFKMRAPGLRRRSLNPDYS